MKKIVKTSSSEELDPQKLLDAAKGAIPIEEATGSHWIDTSQNRKQFYHFRRKVRRGIFTIIKWEEQERPWRDDPALVELYGIIDEQLNPDFGLRWDNFADAWDIHPKNALTIIRREAWVREGGGYDNEVNSCYPHAFTYKKPEHLA